MPGALISAYHGELVIQGFAEDQTDLWTIALTEYVFMSGIVFVFDGRDVASLCYYTLNLHFDSLSGSIQSRLSDKVLEALNYFRLYKLSLQMRTDPDVNAMAFTCCGEVHWRRTAD